MQSFCHVSREYIDKKPIPMAKDKKKYYKCNTLSKDSNCCMKSDIWQKFQKAEQKFTPQAENIDILLQKAL